MFMYSLMSVFVSKLWVVIMSRFGSLSAVKADTEFDGKLWVERTLQGAVELSLIDHVNEHVAENK